MGAFQEKPTKCRLGLVGFPCNMIMNVHKTDGEVGINLRWASAGAPQDVIDILLFANSRAAGLSRAKDVCIRSGAQIDILRFDHTSFSD